MKSRLLSFVAVLGSFTLAAPVQAGNIIWISEVESEAGVEFINLLRAHGHAVTEKVVTSATLVFPGDIDELNAADLVIVSRKTTSGSYNTTDWDDLSVPLMALSPFHLRASKWGWFGAEGLADHTPATVTVNAPGSLLFDGVTVSGGTTATWHVPIDRNATAATDPVINGGVLLASVGTQVLAAQWDAGLVATGPRMFFAAGTREPATGGSVGISGKYNLTETGVQVFLNAVKIYSVPSAIIDSDGDGEPDETDVFPLDPSERRDADMDGTGDNADLDDDNDGVPDLEDLFPFDAAESADSDGDGTGDNADTDDDNDFVPDGEDAFPLDGNEWDDTDHDGTGDNADPDDDGDGVPDPLVSRIVWVSEFDSPAGAEFLTLLRDNGYDVTEYIGSSATLEAAPADVARVMNSAALVVMSRKVGSGSYNTAVWDQIRAPLLAMTPYNTRVSRWGWMNGDTITGSGVDFLFVHEPAHPLFAGMTVDGGGYTEGWHTFIDRGTSYPDVSQVNGGTVLASDGGSLLVAAEWPAGTVATGRRMFLAAGSWEADGGGIETAGQYNLTANGKQALLNAVGMFAVPTLPVSTGTFAIRRVVRNAGSGEVEVEWSAETGVTYGLQRSADLSAWSLIQSGIVAGGETATAVDAAPLAGAVFYRIIRQSP